MTPDKQPFTRQFQRELLVLLLQDPTTYSRFLNIWKASYFDDVNHRKIAEAYLKIRAEGKTHPTEALLKQELLAGIEDVRGPLPMDKAAQLAEVDILYKAQPQNQNYNIEKVRKWARLQAMVEAVGSAIGHVHAGESEKVLDVIETAYRVGTDMQDTGITVNKKTFPVSKSGSPGEYLMENLFRGGISTGMSTLNKYMDGGFRKGEMTTIVGGPGMFKSGMMLNWTLQGLMKGITSPNKNEEQKDSGLNVTYISLEMSEKQVWSRYCYHITKWKKEQLKKDFEDTGNTIGFDNALRNNLLQYCGKLHIKNFGSGTLDLAGLRAYIDQLAGNGHETQLLVVDYPQIMKKDPSERSDFMAIGNLYCGVRGLATEYDIPVIVAAQLNREALKMLDKIGLVHISASMDIARHSDYVAAILQTEEMRIARDKDEYRDMRLKLLKNRNEETGIQIVLKVDYSTYTVMDRGEYVQSADAQAATNSTNSNQDFQARQARKAMSLASKVSSMPHLKERGK